MIHESGNNLFENEKNQLVVKADSEEKKTFEIMRCHPSSTYTAYEIGSVLDIPRGNAARALSNLSGSDSRYRDKFGNFPIRKRKDIRRKDPGGNIRNVTYQWNPLFKVKSAQKNGQISFLDHSSY